MVNSRIHHSKQIFPEKIDRIDFFCLPSGGCLLKQCTPRGKSGRLKQKTVGSSPWQTMQNMGNELAFLYVNTPKSKKKKKN